MKYAKFDQKAYRADCRQSNSIALTEIGCPEAVWVQGKRFAIQPCDMIVFADGYCDRDGQTIQLVAKNKNSERVRETLLHEILHAFSGDLLDDGMAMDTSRNLTEQSVRVASMGLWQVMTDPRNAGLSDWIFHGQRRLFD